jgi:hypothetical protein
VINCKTCDALLDRSLSLASTLRTATMRLARLAEENDSTFDAALEELQQVRRQCELFRTHLKHHAALHESFSPRLAPIRQARVRYDSIGNAREGCIQQQSKFGAK